jgi:hypothetical protein
MLAPFAYFIVCTSLIQRQMKLHLEAQGTWPTRKKRTNAVNCEPSLVTTKTESFCLVDPRARWSPGDTMETATKEIVCYTL